MPLPFKIPLTSLLLLFVIWQPKLCKNKCKQNLYIHRENWPYPQWVWFLVVFDKKIWKVWTNNFFQPSVQGWRRISETVFPNFSTLKETIYFLVHPGSKSLIEFLLPCAGSPWTLLVDTCFALSGNEKRAYSLVRSPVAHW